MTEDEQKKLHLQTNKLKELNNEAYGYFKLYSEGEKAADFIETVKPFADQVKEELDEWKPLALEWIKWKKPPYLHPEQIDQMAENFEILSVTCFQKDTKRKKLTERYKSIEYTLSLILQP
ncbi:YppE family protein [Salipaludibacillus aurantiacus]|uniref:DUF1798 family protein n=1 Tax=Salipaludibacillus aurantiacus TaxID=1601833 RepID=A0A1H9P601_9BACI|nr:YppE family protein [Salipaludibacillus aurantiacus]SER43003.1 protein of unknown function [Salipaludibacillus aurantiacus]